MRKHPAINEFHALLRTEGGSWAAAKREAFERICETFLDDEGLPPASGLRQLERGQFNSRIEGQWKAIFIDAYRQWLGFRMEREFQAPAPPLSLAWWFTAPATARRAGGNSFLRLATPIVVLALLLTLTSVLASIPALSARKQQRQLSKAIAGVVAEQDNVVSSETAARAWLDGGSDNDLETLLANAPTLRNAGISVLTERQALDLLLKGTQ